MRVRHSSKLAVSARWRRDWSQPWRLIWVMSIAFAALLLSAAEAEIGQAATNASSSADLLLQHGLDAFYSLDYSDAVADFQKLTQEQPANPAHWNHLAEARLYQEMYRVGALESQLYGHGDPFLRERLLPVSPQAVAAFAHDNDRAVQLASRAIQANPKNADAHYDLAVAWGLRANFDFVLRRSYMAALSDARKARKEAEKSRQLAPDKIEPMLLIGANNYVSGSLPWGLRMLAALAGFRGQKNKGIEQIQSVARSNSSAAIDAQVLLAVIYRREGNNREVVSLLGALRQRYPRNVLFAVEEAEAAEAAGMHDFALAHYRQVVADAQAGKPGYQRTPLDKVWYDIGNIHRLFSRWNDALAAYGHAEHAPGAKPRYRQAAALASGEVHDTIGDRQQAVQAYRLCIQLGPGTPAAAAAQRYIDHPFHA